MILELETERLYMRPFVLEDAETMFEMESDPAVHLFLGNNPVTDLEVLRGYIKGVIKQYEENGIGRFNMFLKETKEYVGWAGLKIEKQIRDFAYYDLGYRLAQKHWGNGFATEASLVWLNYGFNNMNLKVINAAADVEHTLSNKVLQKVGMQCTEQFEFEGELCNWYELTKPKA